MFTKLISWLIVIGLINFTIGCTVQKTIQIQSSENSFVALKVKDIRSIEYGAEQRIVSVLLENGEEIRFDKTGGKYNPETRTIEGTASCPDAKYKIVSVKLNNGDYVIFNYAGGRYDPNTRTITGYQVVKTDKGTRNKIFVTIKTQDILSIKISEQSDGRTGVAALAVFVVFGFCVWLSGGNMMGRVGY
jgi:hypothetical protein